MYRQLLVVGLLLAVATDLLEARSSLHRQNTHRSTERSRLTDNERQVPVCSEDQFLCVNQSRCIRKGWICDGDNDCGDRSDEPNDCSTRECQNAYVKCYNPDGTRCMAASEYCSGNSWCSRSSLAPVEVECPPAQCGPEEFACARFTKCIESWKVCNGYGDCKDQSDEQNCGNHACSEGQIQCRSDGTCRSDTSRCDGYNDCNDGSDELDCLDYTCPDGYTKCRSDGKCKSPHLRCDGYPQCADGTDELDCLNYTCPDGSFKCRSDGICKIYAIPCDGYAECRDGSDELDCPTCKEGAEHCPSDSNRCISSFHFCDNDDQCGDNSDEAPELCSNRVCNEDQIRCANGQCLDAAHFCKWGGRCRDGSRLREDEPMCKRIVFSAVTSLCENSVYKACDLPSVLKDFETHSHSVKYAASKLAEMEMTEICSSVNDWLECALPEYFSNPFCKHNEQVDPSYRQFRLLAMRVLNFACVQHIDVINREKECLLKRQEATEYRYTYETLTWQRKFFLSCRPLLQANRLLRRSNPYCMSVELQQCFKNVIAEECNEDIVALLDELLTLVHDALSCSEPDSANSVIKRHAADSELFEKMWRSLF